MTLEHWKLGADVVKTAIWPVAIFGLALYFRNDIRALVPRLRKAGLAGVEFDDTRHRQADSGAKELSNVEALGQLEKPESKSPELMEIPGRPRTEVIGLVEKSIHHHLENFDEKRKIPLLARELAQTRLEAAFERVYYTIFGSQLACLHHLIKEGGKVSVATAQDFFKSVKTKFPEFYEKSTFEQWFSFIEGNGLAVVKDGVVEITAIGQEFLISTHKG